MITPKRAYDPISRSDGTCFLVERLWPRGLSKAKLHLDAWLKDVSASTELLLQLRGVGRWTAEYVLLRGLGRLHVFPGDDVGAQKRLGRWVGRPDSLDYAGVRRAVEPWQPYAGAVYFHLLLDGLSHAGALDAVAIAPGQVKRRSGSVKLSSCL